MFKGWETVVALVAAISAAVFARSDFYGDVASEIVTLLGIIMASFIPAMVLAATALRAGAFSVAALDRLTSALDRQVSLFGGLFLYSLVTCGIVIVGKAVKWQGHVIDTGWAAWPTWSSGSLFMPCITFGLMFVALRAISVIIGIRSILRLSGKIAADEARARDNRIDQPIANELKAYTMPADYGKAVDLPH